MKCSFCGTEFQPDAAEQACKSCPFNKGCRLVKCPACGYEIPPEPKSLVMMKKLFSLMNSIRVINKHQK